MKKLIIMVGIPGSGKSTWVSKNQNQAIVISPDQYLVDQYDYEWTPERAGEAWAYSYQQYAKELTKGVDIIWDATFLRGIDRSAVLNFAKGFGYHCTAIYFDTPIAICLERNQNRDREPVPEKTIKNMAKMIQIPREREGFHEIIKIS